MQHLIFLYIKTCNNIGEKTHGYSIVSKKRPPPKPRVSASIPQGVYDRLEKSAQASGRSLSAELVALAEIGLFQGNRSQSPVTPTGGVNLDCYRRIIRAIFEGCPPNRDDCLGVAIDLEVDPDELFLVFAGASNEAV